jgi:hypothetical protein
MLGYKYKILIKLYILVCVLKFCVYGDTILKYDKCACVGYS